MKLSVIMPVYNERRTITEIVSRVQSVEFGGTWVPVFSSAAVREAGEERTGQVFWPVGLNEKELYCVVCKDGATEPQASNLYLIE